MKQIVYYYWSFTAFLILNELNTKNSMIASTNWTLNGATPWRFDSASRRNSTAPGSSDNMPSKCRLEIRTATEACRSALIPACWIWSLYFLQREYNKDKSSFGRLLSDWLQRLIFNWWGLNPVSLCFTVFIALKDIHVGLALSTQTDFTGTYIFDG